MTDDWPHESHDHSIDHDLPHDEAVPSQPEPLPDAGHFDVASVEGMNPGVASALNATDDLQNQVNDLIAKVQHDEVTHSPDAEGSGDAPGATPLFTPKLDILEHPFHIGDSRYAPDGSDRLDPTSSSFGLDGEPRDPTGNDPIENADGELQGS